MNSWVELGVAFTTGVLGPISVILVKNYLEKRKKKPADNNWYAHLPAVCVVGAYSPALLLQFVANPYDYRQHQRED